MSKRPMYLRCYTRQVDALLVEEGDRRSDRLEHQESLERGDSKALIEHEMRFIHLYRPDSTSSFLHKGTRPLFRLKTPYAI